MEEEFAFWFQIGSERQPVYPVRGARQAKAQGLEAICLSGVKDLQTLKGNLANFIGFKDVS